MDVLLFCCIGNAFQSPLVAALYNAEAEALGLPARATSAGLSNRTEMPPTAAYLLEAVKREVTDLPSVLSALRVHKPTPLKTLPYVQVKGVSYLYDPSRKPDHLAQDAKQIHAWISAAPTTSVTRTPIKDAGYEAWEQHGRPELDTPAGQTVLVTYQREVGMLRAFARALLGAPLPGYPELPVAQPLPPPPVAAPPPPPQVIRVAAAPVAPRVPVVTRLPTPTFLARPNISALISAATPAAPVAAIGVVPREPVREPAPAPRSWDEPAPAAPSSAPASSPYVASNPTPDRPIRRLVVQKRPDPPPPPPEDKTAKPKAKRAPKAKAETAEAKAPEVVRAPEPKVEPPPARFEPETQAETKYVRLEPNEPAAIAVGSTTSVDEAAGDAPRKRARRAESEDDGSAPVERDAAVEKAEALEDLRAWVRAALPMRRPALTRYGLLQRAEKHFGTWEEALAAVGIPVADEPLWLLPRDKELSLDILIEALPDPVVARVCELSLPKVRARRRANGAPDEARQIVRRIVATDQLGKLPDEEIAKSLGLTTEEVTQVREAEEIPPPRG